MENLIKKINEQVEKLSYLERRRRIRNMRTLLNRIREIKDKNTKAKISSQLNKAALEF